MCDDLHIKMPSTTATSILSASATSTSMNAVIGGRNSKWSDNVPTVIMDSIFAYVGSAKSLLRSVELTCKRWRQYSMCGTGWHTLDISEFDHDFGATFTNAISITMLMYTALTKIRLQKLQNLYVTGCGNVHPHHVILFTNLCGKTLRTLDISLIFNESLKDWTFPCMNHLETLRLTAHYMVECIVRLPVEICTSLKTFTLNHTSSAVLTSQQPTLNTVILQAPLKELVYFSLSETRSISTLLSRCVAFDTELSTAEPIVWWPKLRHVHTNTHGLSNPFVADGWALTVKNAPKMKSMTLQITAITSTGLTHLDNYLTLGLEELSISVVKSWSSAGDNAVFDLQDLATSNSGTTMHSLTIMCGESSFKNELALAKLSNLQYLDISEFRSAVLEFMSLHEMNRLFLQPSCVYYIDNFEYTNPSLTRFTRIRFSQIRQILTCRMN